MATRATLGLSWVILVEPKIDSSSTSEIFGSRPRIAINICYNTTMFKKILSVITIILVAVIAYAAFTEQVVIDGVSMTMWDATIQAFTRLNVWVLLLIIPEQIFMYFAAGQIYFAFLRARQGIKITQRKLMRVSLEINFVNHALPSAGVSGLGYLIWRLKSFKITAGQVSFIHVLRYAISALANTIQTWIAIVVVLIAGCVRPDGTWALWLAGAVALGIELVIFVAWLIIRRQKTVDWFAATASRVINKIISWVTRGHKRVFLKEEAVNGFFSDLRGDYLAIKRNRKILWRPVLWGAIYAFLELATYWVVAGAMGHPEILPQIMIAEGIASVVGTVIVTPGGVGGYEGAMIAVMVATGVDLSVATIVVVVTRIMVLLGTIVSGWGFYQHALMSRDDRFQMSGEDKKGAKSEKREKHLLNEAEEEEKKEEKELAKTKKKVKKIGKELKEAGARKKKSRKLAPKKS